MKVTLTALSAGTKYALKFRSRSATDISPWSRVFYLLTMTDLTPPDVPDGPILTTKLGAITIEWDGKLMGGDPPLDFQYIEIHRYVTSGFAPTEATLVDTMRTAGITAQSDLAYDTPYYYKFVAVDYSGNRSNPSAEATVTPARLVDTDLGFTLIPGAGSITTAMLANGAVDWSKILPGAVHYDSIAAGAVGADKIAAGAIIAGKIAAFSITAGDISSNAITADKINAGSISAVKLTATAIDGMTITGAVIRTAATGARVQIDSGGLRQYTTTGALSTYLPADGTNGYFKGSIYADQFRSMGANLGSGDYIEIGRTTSGTPDTVDEIRMFASGNVSSLRDPGDRPGTMRISTNEYGQSHLYNFGYYGIESNRFAAQTWAAPYNYIEMSVNEISFAVSSVVGRFSMIGDGNGNGFYRFGSANVGAGFLCLAGGGGVNIRDYPNYNYSDLYLATLHYMGLVPFSMLEYKQNVVKKEIDPMSIIKANGLYTWDWTKESPILKDAPLSQIPVSSVGLIADYMPQWMRDSEGTGYELTRVIGVLWEAIKVLDVRLELLETKK